MHLTRFIRLLCDLDRTGNKAIVFAAPHDELHVFFPSDNNKQENTSTEKRLTELEGSFNELLRTFHGFTGVVTGHQSDLSSYQSVSGLSLLQKGPLTSLSSEVRGRLNSTASSTKRGRSDDEFNTANEDSDTEGFEVPKIQRKKMARRDNYRSNTASAPPIKSADFKGKPRRDAVWGKKKDAPSSAFGGVARVPYVPQAFVHRCSKTTEANNVKESLVADGVQVTDVKLACNPASKFNSFIVTVKTMDDYNKVVSGEFIPENVCVRKYHPPRPNGSNNSNAVSQGWKRSLNELDEISAVSSLRTSDKSINVVVSSPLQVTPPVLPETDLLMTPSQMSTDTR